MKYILFLLITLISTAVFTTANNTQEESVRHVVVFKYKADATDGQIKQITDAFRELQNKIPGITHFEHGINNSPEGNDKGFTHVYQITFEDAEARDVYLPHPEHQEFGKLLGQLDILEDVFVVDYIPET
ncbi:MAG: Dabb family protein [Balneolales bacterium]